MKARSSAVLYFSPLAMRELVESLGPRTREALGALLPGPVTLVVANPLAALPARLPGGPRTARGSPHRRAAGRRPCARSSRPPPTSATGPPRPGLAEVPTAIGEAADLAIDGGALTGLPSTVVDITAIDSGGEWEVLREGGYSLGVSPSSRLSRAGREPLG